MEFCGGGSIQDIYHITGILAENQIAYVCRETLKGKFRYGNCFHRHQKSHGCRILLCSQQRHAYNNNNL